MNDATYRNWLYLSQVWQRMVGVIVAVPASLYAGSSRRVQRIPPSQVLTEGTWLLSFNLSLVIMSVSLSASPEEEETSRRWFDWFMFGNVVVEMNVCVPHVVAGKGMFVAGL